MKLFIIETCVGKGGVVLEKGTTHDTGVVKREEDAEAYQLISTGRALAEKDTAAVAEAKERISAEKLAADAAKKKGAKDRE